MAKLLKFDQISETGKAFGAITYRQFFDSDGQGPVGIEVYAKGSKRYEEGYSVCRLAEAKPPNGSEADIAVQPDHYHPQRSPFVIVGISGKRTMVVGGKNFNVVPGTLLQIGKGEHHKTVNLGKARFVTIELWHSAPHDDEILLTPSGEQSVAEMMTRSGEMTHE